MENLIPLWTLALGLAVGGATVWLFLRTKLKYEYNRARAEGEAERATLAERLAGREQQIQGVHEDLDKQVAERLRIDEALRVESERRSASEQKASRIVPLELELATIQEQNSVLRAKLSSLESKLESEKHTAAEKLSLLVHARDELTTQFKSLANDILDEKSLKFTEQNKTNIETLLKPLGERIRDFEKKVEETYDKESKQRFSLETEIKNLRDLNTRIGQDAINLTNALKGQTKTQGAWGEIILERVLEMSGLVKGREYEVQVTLTSEEGRRSCPDVIVYLPEKRHLVIDSKVNLVAYERYCSLPEGPERDAEHKKNIAAFRKHISELDLKRYQDHYKLNSLDFVLMFVPIEGAFMIAVQHDSKIFDQAFEKNLVIVSPSTLLATMRTISNLWRQEDQNRNALKIAKQAGRLYDKFAGFVEDLEEIGGKLNAAQTSYDNAHNKLVSGRGNIISRVENIRELGARAKKKLPQGLLEDAMEDNEAVIRTALPDAIDAQDEPQTEASETIDSAALPLSLNEGGLFPDLAAGIVTAPEDDSLPLLSSKSTTAGE